MAKTQTFGDKLKKKKGDMKVSIKVIKWFKSEERGGTLRTVERFVSVDDIAQAEKVDISK